MTVTELAAKAIFQAEAKFPAPPSDDGAPSDEEAGPDKASLGATPMKRTLTSKKSSMLAVSDDPFAPREGKTLLWRNVNMTLVRNAT